VAWTAFSVVTPSNVAMVRVWTPERAATFLDYKYVGVKPGNRRGEACTPRQPPVLGETDTALVGGLKLV
jgi:hypothetical protein